MVEEVMERYKQNEEGRAIALYVRGREQQMRLKQVKDKQLMALKMELVKFQWHFNSRQP